MQNEWNIWKFLLLKLSFNDLMQYACEEMTSDKIFNLGILREKQNKIWMNISRKWSQ